MLGDLPGKISSVQLRLDDFIIKGLTTVTEKIDKFLCNTVNIILEK